MPDSLDFEKTLSISFKPTTRRRTIKRIIGKPISKYVTNIRKSINKTIGRIPYIQGKQIHIASSIKEKMNPMYGKGLKKNKTRKHKILFRR
jgi:hypothetical protein